MHHQNRKSMIAHIGYIFQRGGGRDVSFLLISNIASVAEIAIIQNGIHNKEDSDTILDRQKL